MPNRWYRKNCPANVIQTPDRLGDYLVALRNDFVLKHQICRRGLNLSGELGAYEKETRVLLKLASTGRIVNILLRFGGIIEGYMKVMGIEMTEEVLAWKEQLEVERQQRVELFNKILEDEQRLVEAMGDETQQMELMTLLKHDVAKYSAILTPEELDVMSDAYDRVVEHSGIVLVGKPPSWFLSPNDLLCENGIYYLDAVRVSKCLTEEVLSTVTDHESWEDQEEACLRQAAVWADLNHPHVAKMLGACHIGKEPFVVHEPVEPLAANRANAQSWEPVLGWALGLQYLHERELGYKDFDDKRLLARYHVTASGVVTGLGLVPVKRNTSAPLKRGVSNTFSMKDLEKSLQQPDTEDTSPSWSVPNDIFAFGLAIYNTRQWVSMYSDEEVLVLPPERPPFLDEQEWDLVQRMCASTPHNRVSMWYVVHQLLAFVQSSEPKNNTRLVDLSVTPEDDVNDEATERTPERLDDFIVPKMCVKVAKAMVSLERMCGEWDESGSMLKNVFNRLSSLHSQLQARDSIKDTTKIMEAFVNVVDLFYTELTMRNIGKNQSKSSEVATFCASRAAAQNIAVFHHEIDRLLTLAQLRDTSASAQAPPSHVMLADIREDSTDSINSAHSTPDIHDWHIEWGKMRREQLRAFQSCLKNAEELKDQLRDPNARLEAQMLLQFELHKRRSSYPNSVLDAMTQALKVLETLGNGAEAVPSWFIPPYEVVLGKRIAEGGFGEVYYGKWFDTEVVVKILKSQPAPPTAAKPKPSPPTSRSNPIEEDTMELFRSEADHWFMLNHQHVVHLYGACHVGTPFFVCEPAKSTSLYSHVKELACAKPGYNFEENGGDRSDIMRCLFLAGIGLKYLHERGIVHCDLKGNNFMVGTDGKTIKLGDFGMSVLKRSGNGRNAAHENVGAVPWKAPEYLKGDEPTFMSDVYGFGMCIFELLNGKIPWDGLPEAAVRFHVTKRKALPPRPKKFDDFQWSLIQHMCCFEPNERISLNAVVDMLHTFRFEKFPPRFASSLLFLLAMEFLAEENDCGQTLLRLVSRGSAIIAELLRLSNNIPGVFMGPSHVEDPEQLKYLNILFDFAYLKNPEEFENMVNNSTELLDVDDEFMDNNEDILDRFYQLFDGIFKYISDYLEFLDNLEKGFFIQHTLANILLDTDGAQLMCEALYLYGVILLLLDRKIPGPTREKMVIAFYRSKGESALENIDEVCKLCRVTGYLPGQPKPAQYPERYFKRFQPPEEVVSMVIGKLQSDDVYLQEPSFPHRTHRSTRLAAQASMLFVILFFAPDILIHEKASMREIVDRHFNDNFLLPTYMGAVADLSLEWAAYPAARLALANTLEPSNIAHITKKKAQQTQRSIDELNYFLTEGVLTEMYVLENLDPLLNCIRNANVTIRWTMMHSRIQPVIPMMENSTAQREIFDKGTDPDKLITLLLKVSQLEWKLKQMFEALLASKENRWQRCMKETSERMEELSEYFSGEKPLTRVERNEDLMKWFKDLAEKVNSLDYVDHIKAGRRIKRLIEALGHVEQFDQIDTNLQVKAYLEESREFLTEMVRTVRIRDEVMGIIENVSDLSYAWEIINDFMKILHQRVKNDPSSVILLRAMFLKFASILDVPLTRIHQCGSEDVISVAEYYSSELVDYVRRVMEVIPQSVFRILAGIIKLQTDHMQPIPVKFENTLLKNHAQLNERYRLARATNEVSKYTEGILAMKRTLLGIIEVDPRQVLEDGLRKELVYRVSLAFHEVLNFEKNTSEECNEIFVKLASNLDAYRLSFEYIQDYIGIYGLRMWHEELSRIINYNVEQECNRYLKKKVYDRASQFQSRAIPIPRFQPPSDDMSVNFMGRLMHALFIMTDPHTTIYSPQSIGWFSEDGSEVCGIGAFSVLHKSVGLLGLAGLDRMLSFRIVHTLNNLVKFWGSAVTPYFPLLDQLSAALVPEWKLPEHSTKLYDAALKKVEKIMSKLLKAVLIIGQAALIRRQISSELSFSSRLDANLLATTLDTLNISLLNDIRAHYRDPKNKPYPGSDGNPVLVELNKYLENTGANDPFQKIYMIVAEPMEGLAAMFMLFVVAYMPKLQYDRNFGALGRVGKNPIDGEPLLVGILTILKQFHPSYTEKFLAYLGQFVRTKVNDIFAEKADKKGKAAALPTELPVDVVNTLIFMLEFARCAKIKRSILDGHVPAYVFDAIQL